MRKLALFVLTLGLLPAAHGAEDAQSAVVDWEHWAAGNVVADTASLQRGAAHFVNYCASCHSLKYMRYQRVGTDLHISDDQLEAHLLPAGAKVTDYMTSSMPAADAEAWFGIAPPDLSLIARSKGPDYVYQFLKTFYADPTRPTGVNNLALEGTAMPHVLADLQGVQAAVFLEEQGERDGEAAAQKQLAKFETIVPGQLSAAEYDLFVRDLVNFLDYVGEPTQVVRATVGIWVVLFLLAFTGIAWLLKQEYWKDVS